MMIHAELGLAEPDQSDDDFTNNAAYVAYWLKTLRSDRKEVFRAAADAQRIADYLLAFHLIADTPMVAGTHPAHPADPPPWTGTMWAPLQHVAAAFRAGGAEVLNLDDGAARPDGAVP